MGGGGIYLCVVLSVCCVCVYGGRLWMAEL